MRPLQIYVYMCVCVRVWPFAQLDLDFHTCDQIYPFVLLEYATAPLSTRYSSNMIKYIYIYSDISLG